MTMSLKESVELFEEMFGDDNTAKKFNEAWMTIKEKLIEVNKLCPHCGIPMSEGICHYYKCPSNG